MDVRDTIHYITGLTEKEIESMPEAVSRAGLRKIVKLIPEGLEESPLWVYIGRRHDHLVIPGMYCTCKSFTIRVMARKQLLACKHLVIQRIAEKNKTYRTLKTSINEYLKIIHEILSIGMSPTLRNLLYIQWRKREASRNG